MLMMEMQIVRAALRRAQRTRERMKRKVFVVNLDAIYYEHGHQSTSLQTKRNAFHSINTKTSNCTQSYDEATNNTNHNSPYMISSSP